MSRVSELKLEDMTPRQREVYEEIVAGPRKGARGPFNALLRSPDLAEKAQKLGAYCRFQTALEPRVAEMAILMTARQWRANFEWYAHAILAREAGLDPAIIDAIEAEKRPAKMADDEAIVWDFFRQTYDNRRVDDATYARAKAAFGERGVCDLVGVMGYYSLVSMTLNTFQVPLPPGEKAPFD